MVTLLRNCLLMMGAMFVAFVLLKDNMALLTSAVQKSNGNETSVQRSYQNQASQDYAAAADNEVVLEPDRWGQYYLTAEINGRDITFLVDTGASSVALTQEDADSIGYPVHQMDYSGTSWTANGTAKFAPVVLDEVYVGDKVVNNVSAVVMQSSMRHSLLGMTFLRKLASFGVKNNRLHLRW